MAQSVVLALLVLPLVLPLVLLALLELEELQPTVSSRPAATAAPAARACLARKIPSQTTVPGTGTEMPNLG